jgi:hypothetical protein
MDPALVQTAEERSVIPYDPVAPRTADHPMTLAQPRVHWLVAFICSLFPSVSAVIFLMNTTLCKKTHFVTASVSASDATTAPRRRLEYILAVDRTTVNESLSIGQTL